jgi:Winged helix-turn helix
MMTLHLGKDEHHCLEDTFHTTPDRRLRDRCQAILMAARGRRHRLIAEDLGISVRTLQRWLNTDRVGGLAGLTIHWASGRAPRIPAALAPAMLTWVKHGPAGGGLDRANWTDCRAGHPPVSHARDGREREYQAELLYPTWRAPVSPNVPLSQSRPGPANGGPPGAAGLSKKPSGGNSSC